jgi:hypothetical protein
MRKVYEKYKIIEVPAISPEKRVKIILKEINGGDKNG